MALQSIFTGNLVSHLFLRISPHKGCLLVSGSRYCSAKGRISQNVALQSFYTVNSVSNLRLRISPLERCLLVSGWRDCSKKRQNFSKVGSILYCKLICGQAFEIFFGSRSFPLCRVHAIARQTVDFVMFLVTWESSVFHSIQNTHTHANTKTHTHTHTHHSANTMKNTWFLIEWYCRVHAIARQTVEFDMCLLS